MTNQLPPAPEGFAWMPCLKASTVAGDALLIDGRWRVARTHTDHTGAERAACLMRRLGATEKPWDGCAFLGGCGTWAPKGEPMGEDHILNESVVAPNAGWYAPARFVPGHVPDFGGVGRRYLDCTAMPSDMEHLREHGLAEDEQWACPINLPPLPEQPLLDQLLGDDPGRRAAFQQEKERVLAEEVEYRRARDTKPPQEDYEGPGPCWCSGGREGAEVCPAHAPLPGVVPIPADDERPEAHRLDPANYEPCVYCGLPATGGEIGAEEAGLCGGDGECAERAAKRGEELERLRAEHAEMLGGWKRATEGMLRNAMEIERLQSEAVVSSEASGITCDVCGEDGAPAPGVCVNCIGVAEDRLKEHAERWQKIAQETEKKRDVLQGEKNLILLTIEQALRDFSTQSRECWPEYVENIRFVAQEISGDKERFAHKP